MIEQVPTSRMGDKVRSYTLSYQRSGFKREILDFAEKKSISAATLKDKLHWHSVRDWKKKMNELE